MLLDFTDTIYRAKFAMPHAQGLFVCNIQESCSVVLEKRFSKVCDKLTTKCSKYFWLLFLSMAMSC